MRRLPPDLGGVAVPRSRGTNATLNVGHLPSPGQTKPPIVQHGAEGPDALQVFIKVPMAVLTIVTPGRGGLGPVP